MRTVLATTLMFATAAASAQTVYFNLSSSEANTNVHPGDTIEWSIGVSVSSGNNQGLAFATVDLTQAATNPAFLDIPPASGVPIAFVNFNRPSGICNPGESFPLSGFVGLQRGTAGRKNLVQIGGAQNTSGLAMPSGTGVAQNAVVRAGVGQAGEITLASGTFAAPAVSGVYTFQLSNPAANVLTAVHAPPSFSPVTAATVSMPNASITFTVGEPNCPGDIDRDNDVDISDLSVLLSQFGSTGVGLWCDLDHDADVDISDLSLLLSNFGTTC